MHRFTLLLALCFALTAVQIVSQTWRGKASYYASKFHGRRTASGEKYHKDSLTGAHRNLPFGTLVKVRNLKNDSTVVLRINDRLPHGGRIIDVSLAGAKQLNFIREGLANVEIELYQPDEIQPEATETK